MIKYFTIYGERCSGTNFLESSIINNFKIDITWNYGWKHFFGNYDFSIKKKETDETLFIGIIRDPINWLDSLYKNPHHIPQHNRLSPNEFLLNEHYSTIDNYSSIEEHADRNIITKKRYKNIFELRQVKTNYLIYFMPAYVKNYVFIKYEDLKNNYDFVLLDIQQKFNLIRHNNNNMPFFRTIKYKGLSEENDYKEKTISFTNEIINIIKNNLDIEQECNLGYL